MKSGLKGMEMDRISDLPRPILHHILSYLSQNDAVKTGVLSKSWRYLWHGRPNVEFCIDDFKGTAQNFISVLDQTLIRYDNQNLSIKKFILKMPEMIDPVSAPFLEKWIPIIVIKGIETFHLSFHYKYRPEYYFDLPSVVFLSESLREIYLKGCKISSTDKVLFRHLQTLRLHHVQIANETFRRIMSSCPLIEKVSLIKCEGFYTIKVNNHNCSLKYFEFRSWNWSNFEIADVSRIETIYLKSCKDWFEHHCNNSFTHLKSLHLSYVNLTTKSVHSFSCNFPCLEELELSNCLSSNEEFQLSSHSIKRFAIKADDDPIKVSIDAPNILEFEYKGWDFPSSISFTTTSNKWKSNIVLTTDLDDRDLDYMSKWLHKLDELLKVLSRSETSLHILVFCSWDYNRVYGLDYHYDEAKVIVKHLELCLGRRLCSDYSVCLELEEKTIKKWNSQRNIY